MKPVSWKIIVGLLLFVIGGLILMQTLGVFSISTELGEVLLPSCFLAGGIVFLYVLISSKANWWASIPAFTLIGLSILLGAHLLPFANKIISLEEYAVGIFLAFIGLGFWVIYFLDTHKWWAIIPGGAMVSVGALVAFGMVCLLFLGLAATFGLLYLLPTGGKRMTWPLIPAGVLGILGVSFLWGEAGGGYFDYIIPALLVAGGLALILATVIKKK